MVAMGSLAAGAHAITIADSQTEEACTELTLSGTEVTGGCLIEDMEGEFTILTAGTIFNHFNATFDMRIDSAGNFYAVDQFVWVNSGFSRQQCDDPISHDPIPWEGSAIGGMHMTMCLEAFSGQGGGTQLVNFKNSFEAYGNGHIFLGMNQKESPSSGIAWAEFDNGGSNNEILILP